MSLKQFYDNSIEREEVKEFMVQVLGEMATEQAFEGKDTSGFKPARECVDRLFDTLKERYGKPEKVMNFDSK